MSRSLRPLILLLVALSTCLALGQGNTPPDASLTLEPGAKAGERIKGSVTVTFASGLHAYQNPPSKDFLIPVSVVVGTPGFTLVSASYPSGDNAVVGGDPDPVRVYEGTIHIPIVLQAPAKAGSYEVLVAVKYQQCNENNCYQPDQVDATAKIVLAAAPLTTSGANSVSAFSAAHGSPKAAKRSVPMPTSVPEIKEQPKGAASDEQPPGPDVQPAKPETQGAGPFVSVKPSTKEEPSKPDAKPNTTPKKEPPPKLLQDAVVASVKSPPPAPAANSSEDGFIASHLRSAFKTGNYSLILVLALLIGLALSATPCVYPMIPVTVGFFSNQTAGNRFGRVWLGLMYMFGLAATYGAVGGLSAALGGSIGSLFQASWFLFALAIVMAALALSMFDVYEIRLPQFLSKKIHGRSGPAGALVMGLLMGFAAAPCAGPLVAVVAAQVAETKSVSIGVLLFTFIGLGIGLPFFALGAFASGAKGLPRAGGWLKTVKAILGLVVLGLALNYFLQAYQYRSEEPRTMAVKALFLVAAAVYLFVAENSGNTKAIWALKGVAILFCGLWAGQLFQARATAIRDQQLAAIGAVSQITWIPFSAESFEAAKKSGKPIVIDASADWCAICHEIEDAVFNKPEGIAAMQGVVALKIDQSTGVDPKYVEMTNQMFHIVGLPHLEIMKPGGEAVKVITGKAELDSPERLKEYLQLARA